MHYQYPITDWLLHNEGLEQLDSHFFRKTTLIDLQFRSYDDNGTSGVVHTFSQKVLTERPDFPFIISDRDLRARFPVL